MRLSVWLIIILVTLVISSRKAALVQRHLKSVNRQLVLLHFWLILRARVLPVLPVSRIVIPICIQSSGRVLVALSIGLNGIWVVVRYNVPWAHSRWTRVGVHAHSEQLHLSTFQTPKTSMVPSVIFEPQTKPADDGSYYSPRSSALLCTGIDTPSSPTSIFYSGRDLETIPSVTGRSHRRMHHKAILSSLPISNCVEDD